MSTLSTQEFQFTRADFDYLRDVIVEATGIVSSEDKYTMYYARLAKRLRILGLQDFSAYRDYLQRNAQSESIELINSITTNLTSFFRESHHFDFLTETIVPAAKRRGKRRLRIWSAGCSSGEEAYSIAISLQSAIEDIEHWDIRIVATDIDSEVLAYADAGRYDADRVKDLDARIRARCFQLGDGKQADKLVVSEDLRQLIQFRQLNLMNAWPFDEAFDIIFCRNVVIYFSRQSRVELVDRFADQLCPRGWLLMGHSESLFNTTDRFESLGNTVYRLVDPNAADIDPGVAGNSRETGYADRSSRSLRGEVNQIANPAKCVRSLDTDTDIIAIGASTGGTEAINELLNRLGANVPGILVTQHIPGHFSATFAERLNQQIPLEVCVAADGQPVRPGQVYLAPGDRHLKLDRVNGRYLCRLDDGPFVNRHKPSVDVLFASVAQSAGAKAVGILLTGMGDDGAEALGELQCSGAVTIAQDESSSVVWGMPGVAVRRGHADHVLEISQIAQKVLSLVSKSWQNN